MVSVFISYSHVDEELRRQLDTHLMSLRRQGLIDVWHDRRIGAGEEFPKAIDDALADAEIILLLVSPDFIASSYCYEIEMQEALRRHEIGTAVVIPVILRACDWHDLPFGKLHATPDGKPVKLFPDLDSAFLTVVQDIKAAARKLMDRGASGSAPSAAPFVASGPVASSLPAISGVPRSGNLRVKKEFTDFDRDQFRADSYTYIARYFENSLIELGERNPEVHTVFRSLDATAFEAAIYDHSGKARCHCGVWMRSGRGFGGEIAYSNAGVGDRNGFNESLSVGDDGTSLGLKALGMMFRGGGGAERALLTQAGAAEYLWSTFIEPMQR